MTILTQSRRPKQYRLYLVCPTVAFNPTNWQVKPQRYTVLERLTTTKSPGKADALRFLRNQEAMRRGDVSAWVIAFAD